MSELDTFGMVSDTRTSDIVSKICPNSNLFESNLCLKYLLSLRTVINVLELSKRLLA
jgi:hypothetical protein